MMQEQRQCEPMSPEDVLGAIKREVAFAGDDQNEREENRVNAMAYFRGESPLPPDAEDEANNERSSIVSTDVADAVEAVLAEILPAFSGQNPVEFLPLGPDDEEQSDLETRAVSHVANAAGAFMGFNMSVKDALLRRAGIIKTYWEEDTTVEYQSASNLDPQMLPELLADTENSVAEVHEAMQDEMTGLVSGTIRRYTKSGKPRLAAVPLDEFLISTSTNVPDADEARFVAHQRPVTRDELVRMGFQMDMVYELTPYDQSTHEATTARQRTMSDTDYESGHKSTESVMVCESYYRIDEDGDGIAELRRIVTAGGSDGTQEILLDEPWDEQPFSIGVPYLGIYTWDGISLFDKLRQVQDVKTDMLRGLLDTAERNLKQRIGVIDRQANMDDVFTSVMGGAVRMKKAGAVFPFPEVQINPQMFNILGYMDEMRRDKGGGAVDTAAQASMVAGDSAHGLERTMTAYEQVNAMVAKNLCETLVIPTYRKLHALLRKYWTGEINFKDGTGQWGTAAPEKWSPRTDLVVAMGMSVGERGRRSAALQQVLMNQTKAMETGNEGILTDMSKVYNTLMDQARMGGLPMPEQYYIHPQSPEAKETAQQNQQQKQQDKQEAQQKEMMALQLQQAQLDMLPRVEMIKQQTSLQVQDMKSQVDAMKAEWNQINAMFGHRVDLAKANAEYDNEPVPDNLAELTPRGPA